MEIWKDVKNYEGMYQISNKGRMKSIDRVVKQRSGGTQVKRGMIIKESVNYKGYLLVSATKYNKVETWSTHRLVAETFIPNKSNKPQVNHIDSNKKNNNVNNLEWVTAQDNIKHSWEAGTHKLRPEHMELITDKARTENNKSVSRYTKDLVYIDTFNSITEGANHVGVNYRGVSACVNGNQITSGGYKWKLTDQKT